jgi:SAM-dependent methyltransferase
VFDDPAFAERFLAKRQLDASVNNQLDVPGLLSLAGPISGRTVLELGCAAGDFASVITTQRPDRYVGVDRSSLMIEKARRRSLEGDVEFRVSDISELDLADRFDLVFSGLTLHFVADIDLALRKVRQHLSDNGLFVFSVRHPIRTSNPAGLSTDRSAWIVKDYFRSGPREIRWFGKDLFIFHRTLSDWYSALCESGLRVSGLLEPCPAADANLGEDEDDANLPGLLIFRCQKAVVSSSPG